MVEISPQVMLERFHEVRLLVLGDVMLDSFVYGSVERISPEAPIPVLAVDRAADMLGGAANVARNAASMGARVTLIGVAGQDEAAQKLKSLLAQIPTIEPRLVSDPSRLTTFKERFVASRQQILRVDREQRTELSGEPAAEVLTLFREAVASSDVVVLSDYAKGVLSDRITQEVINAARSAHKPLIVDPKGRSFDKYRGANVLTPNRQELALAYGVACDTDEQVESAGRSFVERGACDAMVVTRGSLGMSVIANRSDIAHLPGRAREVFDVSGAGDTAIATLAMGLATGSDIVSAARIANVAAGLVVAKFGTAIVTSGEIAAALKESDGGAEDGKLFTLDHVIQKAHAWHTQGLKVAFANGCFDLLHTGHVSLLEQARRAANRLIVGLNSDLSVRRLKGDGRPVQSEIARATILSSLKAVDAVVIFAEDTPRALIEALLPDVLVKGSDYTVDNIVGADLVLNRGGRVLIADLVPDQSTSATVAKVAASRQT